jgi:hypothetical protein
LAYKLAFLRVISEVQLIMVASESVDIKSEFARLIVFELIVFKLEEFLFVDQVQWDLSFVREILLKAI